mmetsp:Transcript_36718/g.59332  ORF Transcript_36718/g.59332 Transcript_36718/m.59332 type:complete len:155 (+) Transcript_36718:60-524(+)|eukprot:CAMPEP_0184661568 /NCGR_PEP_ID=MMETSP0308-20130426/39064_1 /TAXON_ID=38269 /ORGANISM="Gloeochaete witrockiana, Strain SAG 46.84" /LENGTH=154 /DNA_ID=CAMNT_0027102967 /DNA_START=48 /DNA_END=512 /DNA_ORIENTATION=+
MESAHHPIYELRRKYYFLSNFYESPIFLDGFPLPFPTLEHAFQAAKTDVYEEREMLLSCGKPKVAKDLGRTVTLRDNWDSLRLQVMGDLLFQKFSMHADLCEKLLATGDCLIEEGNTWNDTYWGVCNGIGENHLGKLLMKTRDKLREQTRQKKT